MKKQIEQVAKFNRVSGAKKSKGLVDKDLIDFRFRLIDEELEEMRAAAYNNDPVEFLDGLGDLLVVLFGAADSLSFNEVLPEAFHRIMKSNMSKFAKTEAEAIEKVKEYWDKEKIEAYYKKVDDLYVIARSSDNKTLKGLNYKRVNLTDLI